MGSSCDGCGTTYLPGVHYCVVCGASLRQVSKEIVPRTAPPPPVNLPAKRHGQPPSPTPVTVAPARRRRRFERPPAGVLTAALVAAAGACVVGGLWWLFSGDEPPAAEYVELEDRRIHALSFSPDGTKLFVDTNDVDQIRWTWDLGARPWEDVDAAPGDEATEQDRLTAVALSPDGTLSATGEKGSRREEKILIFTWDYVYTNGVVQVRKQDTGEIAWTTPVRELDISDDEFVGNAQSLTFSPDGSLLVGDYSNSTTLVWDAATGAVRAKLKGDSGQFSPDGRLLALDAYDEVHLWDAATRKVKTKLAAPDRKVGGSPVSFQSLEFSPDGRLLATSLSDDTVQFWDTATGAERATGPRPTGNVLRFSPDGQLLAIRASDGTVLLWDIAAGAEVVTAPRPTGDLLAFSPDGRWLVTSSGDGTLRLWDSTSSQETRVLEHRERFLLWTTEMAISHIAFSPDGTKLAAASNTKEDARVALWELP